MSKGTASVLLLMLLLSAGCQSIQSLFVSGVGSGIEYTLTNVAYKTLSFPITDVRVAAQGALKRLAIKELSTQTEGKVVKIIAETQDYKIYVDLTWITENATKISVDARSSIIFKDKPTATAIIEQTEKILEGEIAEPAAPVVPAGSGELLSLNAKSAGNGKGSLSSATAGVTCSVGSCEGTLESNTIAIVSADAAAGSTFTSWSGCDSVRENRCLVTMKTPRTVTARFTLRQHTLVAGTAGTGAGTISSATSGVACASTNACSGTLDHGANALITAQASPGSVFGGWSGCDTVVGTTCAITMNSAKAVLATFVSIPQPPPSGGGL